MLLLAAFTTSPSVRAHGDSGDVWVTRQSTEHLFMVPNSEGSSLETFVVYGTMAPNDRNTDEDML